MLEGLKIALNSGDYRLLYFLVILVMSTWSDTVLPS